MCMIFSLYTQQSSESDLNSERLSSLWSKIKANILHSSYRFPSGAKPVPGSCLEVGDSEQKSTADVSN